MTDVHDADVIIVGAGIGGLTAGAFLAATGKRCVVLDRHHVVGGNISAFTHEGFEFDVGTHYVGDCGPGGLIPSIYGALGLGDAIKWRPLDPDGFDRYVFPDATYDIPAGLDHLEARLLDWFPGERSGVEGTCQWFADINEGFKSLALGQPTEKAMLLFQERETSLTELFARFGLSPRARAVIGGQHLLYGAGPATASALTHAAALMHYMSGAFYPQGGGQRMSDLLAEFIRSHGGEVHLRHSVEQILVEGGRAVGVRVRPPAHERRAGAPTELHAPVVLSNADLKRTCLELVGEEHLPPAWVEQIRSLRMGPPMFVVYAVLDRDLAAEGYPNANQFVLSGDDGDVDYRALDRGEMATDPTLFISIASLKDPTNTKLCRAGQTNLQVMALAPHQHEYWGLNRGPAAGERYRKHPAYLDRKAELAELTLKLAERAIPGLTESIVYQETATPATHERFVRSTEGTSYGFAPTVDQGMDKRPAPITPLPGLFLAGQGLMPGHGIAACMTSGVMAAAAISGEPLLDVLRGNRSLV